jgi:hypothetical protein
VAESADYGEIRNGHQPHGGPDLDATVAYANG